MEIFYFDQDLILGLARLPRDDPTHKKFLPEVFELVKHLVENGAVAIPYSEVHLEETAV